MERPLHAFTLKRLTLHNRLTAFEINLLARAKITKSSTFDRADDSSAYAKMAPEKAPFENCFGLRCLTGLEDARDQAHGTQTQAQKNEGCAAVWNRAAPVPVGVARNAVSVYVIFQRHGTGESMNVIGFEI